MQDGIVWNLSLQIDNPLVQVHNSKRKAGKFGPAKIFRGSNIFGISAMRLALIVEFTLVDELLELTLILKSPGMSEKISGGRRYLKF